MPSGRAAGPEGIQSRLEELTSRGLPITLLGGGAVTALALLRRSPLRTAVASGVGVAVAAVPEGLPLMATVAQLGAARRLSGRGVLVRASRTVEALGRVDTVCFDKTGTLTEGRLRLVRVAGFDGDWAPEDPRARRVLRAAAQAGPQANGQPLAHATDQAVLDAARAVLGDDLDQAWEELVEVPFHSERGFSAVLGRTPRKARLVLKGAPEVLLPRCGYVRNDDGKRPLDRAERERAAATVHSLAVQGLRVLAVARRNANGVAEGELSADDVSAMGDLTLLGFIGIADTPRPRAAGTVAGLREVGLRPVMITGDHPVTARAVAQGLGIPVDVLVAGPDLAGLEEPERVRRVAGASVFARVSPEQKLQVVDALRKSGRVVAMVGDGANDAAAIRMADVGIGMEAKGSTSARSAADLVLTEPDVSLLLDALVEGRAMWRRVRDGVAVLLGGNAGEILFTLLGTALAGRAPISTRQFLVVNMFTDLLPSMALAVAPTPSDEGERRALLTAEPPSLGAPLLREIGLRGTVTSAGALVAWLIARRTASERRASTVALATLVGAELGQTLLLSGRNPLVLATGLGSAAVLAAIIQLPGASQVFGCTPLGPLAWAIVLACSTAATVASAALPRLFPALLTGEEPRTDAGPNRAQDSGSVAA
jgi:cation-transporting ATPase I